VKVVQNKEFWIGVIAALVVLKFGDKLPVIGPSVAKLKI
jgi:hypothetical protein